MIIPRLFGDCSQREPEHGLLDVPGIKALAQILDILSRRKDSVY